MPPVARRRIEAGPQFCVSRPQLPLVGNRMLRLETFGGLRLTFDGREHVQPRMRLALLARLAAAGHQGLARDEVLACFWPDRDTDSRSEEHTSELQSLRHLVCR